MSPLNRIVTIRVRTVLALFVLMLLASPLAFGATQAASIEDEGLNRTHLTQTADKPFILPFKEPAGPDTWLLGQTYGNTVGAYFNRNTTYRYSQGIHFGVDLSAPCGTEIVAIADGVVALVDATAYGSAPHNLIIDHPQLDYASLYGHLLEKPNLQPGQEVKQGEVIEILKKEGLRSSVKVMVGGAPVTRDWVQKIGADGYSEDAIGAVNAGKQLVGA